jgi:hypothetical protein
MNWVLIKKDPEKVIKKYTDKGVKEYLQKEGSYQCVYCALKDNVLGGIDHYHVEHYKPKSNERFKYLVNDYKNLFYSCPICNRFKWMDWPADPAPDHSIPAYPNPSEIDYNSIFDINFETGEIFGKFPASKYMEKKLYLNRPHLILERKRSYLSKKYRAQIKNFDELSNKLVEIKNIESANFLRDLALGAASLSELLLKLDDLPSYESKDIRK